MRRSKAPSALANKPASTPPSSASPAPTTSYGTPKTTTSLTKPIQKPATKPTPKPATKPTEEDDQQENEDIEISQDSSTSSEASETPKPSKTGLTFKTPFKSPISSNAKVVAAAKAKEEESLESTVYSVMWCNFSMKKHKSWNDGVLRITGVQFVLKDMEGKDIAKSNSISKKVISELTIGSQFKLGGKEVELLNQVDEEEFNSGKIFLAQSAPTTTTTPAPKTSTLAKKKFIAHSSTTAEKQVVQPKYSPEAEGAVVLWSPKEPFDSSGKPQVAVVVDPYIAQHLRPHQKQGVKFMYNSVMDVNQENTYGCILADEMGLGKTLQSLALVWTLLRQGPHGTPITKKVVVITPTTLLDNWRKEIKRWLGTERLKFLSMSDFTKNVPEMITEFINAPIYQVLLITYEQCMNNTDLMEKINCGLVICDEGHRIKNSQTKTAIAINKINTRRRVILSGTPIQNDLEEFFSMADFCNPGILQTLSLFKKVYASPIITGRYPNAKPQEKKIGQARSKELTRLTSKFILRRKANILEKYLPLKVEQVVFCKLSPLQVQIYQHLLKSKSILGLLSGGGAGTFALDCITNLTKLTNHPTLVWNLAHGLDTKGELTDKKYGFDGCDALFPAEFDPKQIQPEYSGKFSVLASLLKAIRESSKDKVVLVSNSKQTLNLFQQLCEKEKYACVRLDGDLAVTQRQRMVDEFNQPSSSTFVFLLSIKAGGVGLNLIGANRLVLFDSGWNPAHDRQAMARVWRDGQTKQVFIYRFLATGTIDEKIYQRQIMKQGLSNSVIDDDSNSKRHFKSEDLRNIFSLNLNTACDTHDLIKCSCLTAKKSDQSENSKNSEISNWFHYASTEHYEDALLKEVAEQKDSPISFVFCSPPHEDKEEVQEEEIENEAAREDIYMCVDDKEAAIEEDDTEKPTKKRGAKKESKDQEEAEEDVSPKSKRTRKAEKVIEPDTKTEEVPAEPQAADKIPTRKRLTKKIEEEDNVDMLEMGD